LGIGLLAQGGDFTSFHLLLYIILYIVYGIFCVYLAPFVII